MLLQQALHKWHLLLQAVQWMLLLNQILKPLLLLQLQWLLLILLLHKKLTPPEGPYAIGKPINITLQVWNQGPGNAYSVVVTDENWKQDKFRTIFQGNNFTLDFLNAGEQYMHECAPCKRGPHPTPLRLHTVRCQVVASGRHRDLVAAAHARSAFIIAHLQMAACASDA